MRLKLRRSRKVMQLKLWRLLKAARQKLRGLVRIRKAHIPQAERDVMDRYGENVIAQMLSGGSTPRAKELHPVYQTDAKVKHAARWLTERADSRERRDQWISTRDFILEIVVIALIGWEIRLGYQQARLQSQEFGKQSQEFDKQQQILTNLEKSSTATANTLVSLQRTTELMNTTLQMQLDAARKSVAQTERGAKASEASATTASQTLRVSERAYVYLISSLLKKPSAGERVQLSILIGNSGRTPAIELSAISRAVIISSSASLQEARDIAFTAAPETMESVSTLPSGQTQQLQTESKLPLAQSEVDQVVEGKLLIYVFATASYKDILNQPHQTEICGFYNAKQNAFLNCHKHNKSD
jgi:hypothetical protein